MNKNNNAYKTIGEVVKILDLKSEKVIHYPHILSDIGKKSLNKLNLRF